MQKKIVFTLLLSLLVINVSLSKTSYSSRIDFNPFLMKSVQIISLKESPIKFSCVFPVFVYPLFKSNNGYEWAFWVETSRY